MRRGQRVFVSIEAGRSPDAENVVRSLARRVKSDIALRHASYGNVVLACGRGNSSSRRICMVRAGWVTFKIDAAPVNLLTRATVRKERTCSAGPQGRSLSPCQLGL